MPFAAKPMSDEDQEKQKVQNGGVNISGNSTSFSTGVPGQDAGNRSRGSSGNYANIQSYLDANKEQADNMGQTIASSVDQSATEAQQKIAGLETKAPKVEAYDPNEVFNNVTSLTDDQKNAYRTQRTTGGYDGPQTVDKVDGYTDVQKAASDASNKVKNTGSEVGQQQLLKETYARPQYSAGENRLDQVLLQNSAGSKQALENVGTKYKDLDSLFSNATTKVGDSINAANTQALANKQSLLAAEQQQYDKLLNPIQQRADQANIDNPIIANKYAKDLGDNILSEDTLQKLGLKEGTRLYDQQLDGYFKAGSTMSGVDNVATADERARYQALSDLIQDPTRTQITSTGKAIDPYTFDKERFEQENAAKNAEMDKLFSEKQINGEFKFDHNDGYAKGFAYGNVADYLKNGIGAVTDIFQYERPSNGGGSFTNQAMADAVAGARAQAYAKLEDFLQQQQYGRTIQKG